MIFIKTGNLMDSKAEVIAHQTNYEGVMGGGAALCIKEKHPDVYKTYASLCK